MKNTIKDMMMSYTTTEALAKAFATLWRRARLHGFVMEFEDEILMASYLDWYVEYDENKNGLVTFYDDKDAEIVFKRTGRSGYSLELVRWNFDTLACLRDFKFED